MLKTALAVFLFATPLWAANFKLNPKYLPKKVTQARASTLVRQLKTFSDRADRKRDMDRQRMIQVLNKIAKPAQDSFSQAMQANPPLAKRVEQYNQELKALLKTQLSPEQKFKMANDLSQKVLPAIEQLWAKANINEKLYQSKIEQALGGLWAFDPNAFASDGSKPVFKWRKFLNFELFYPRGESTFKPDVEVVLAPPFALEKSDVQGGDAFADPEEGRYNAYTMALAVGGQSARSGVGQFVVTDGAFRKIKISAAISDSAYHGFAGAILGASGSDTSNTVEVISQNDIACSETFNTGSALSAVIWWSTYEGGGPLIIECTFDAPPSGTEIVVNLTGDSSSWAGGGGESSATTSVEIRDITVKFQR
jgi:hypothetical protein